MTPAEEGRQRYEDNVHVGRQLAEKMAHAAESIAGTLERMASVHEHLASSDGYPLKEQARVRAEIERRIARDERLASGWFRSIARAVPTGEGR